MTGGGDCPGLNAVIRAVTKTAITRYSMKVWGIEDGYLGLIEKRLRPLSFEDVSHILTLGGTILGTNNIVDPFKFAVRSGTAEPANSPQGKVRFKDVSDSCIQTLAEKQIDALVCIGGDGTMTSAAAFAKKGLTVVGVPKTIDNDLWGTDITFGFNTAVTTATEAIDKLRTTASSHHRVMVVEVMGRYAGWIALHSGVASGGDCILIPEIPYRIEKVCRFVQQRNSRGKSYSIVVVAEGAKESGGKMVVSKNVVFSPYPVRLGGIAYKLADQIERLTKLESRAVTLGHIQRGGTPTPYDRILATSFGFTAMELLVSGVKDRLVVLKDGKLSSVPLSQVAGKIKTVPKNHPLIKAARAVNTCFGD